MFVDTRTLDEDALIEKTVCVVGAGVAGITLALELERAGIDACILESGGFEPDEATMDLNRGFSTGIPYQFADGCRSRYLGGSSNCWGGWNRPFEEIDFRQRHWVPGSGWPMARDELRSYYERAHPLLQLGPDQWDAEFWERAINKHTVRRVPLTSGQVQDIIFQFSPPTRLGAEYRSQLEHARKVQVYLHANVVDIETDPAATTVTRLKVRTLSGRTVWAKAKQFILAAGGIENIRLLLNANNVQAAGLGNGHDQVGRFYLEHPRLLSGKVRFRKEWVDNMLYDCRFHALNPSVSAHGVSFGGHFVLSPEVQEREGVLNAQTWFHSLFPGEGTDASKALMRVKLRATGAHQPGFTWAGDIATLLGHPIDTFGFALTRLFHISSWVTGVKFQTIVEPAPDPDSRVMLSDERDALGLRRVLVDWRLGPQVRRTFDRNWAIIADELKMNRVADVELDPTLEDKEWPAAEQGLRHHMRSGHVMVAQQDSGWPRHPEWSWHHMGGTRMHESPRDGVVDRDLKVHGMSNLHITGSSVFPTAAANFPTMTIAALTCRLADRLAKQLSQPELEVGSSPQPMAMPA